MRLPCRRSRSLAHGARRRAAATWTRLCRLLSAVRRRSWRWRCHRPCAGVCCVFKVAGEAEEALCPSSPWEKKPHRLAVSGWLGENQGNFSRAASAQIETSTLALCKIGRRSSVASGWNGPSPAAAFRQLLIGYLGEPSVPAAIPES